MTVLESNNPFRDHIPSTEKQAFLSVNEGYDEYIRSPSPIPPQTPERGSRESSPARSDYAEDPDLRVDTKSAVKVLDMLHTTSRLDLKIFDPTSNTCIFYVENSALTPKKPDVLLFRGPDKQGHPMAAVARWKSMFGKTVDFGIGDAGAHLENSTSIPWEAMTAQRSLKMNDHRFKVPGDPSGKLYMWKRTHHEGVEKGHNSLSSNNFKLLDMSNNEIVATFANNRFKSWKKFGKLTFRQDLGEQAEMAALITCLALVEKGRRRARAQRNSPVGGGGGG
jgi:hypothetical protein